MVGATACSHYEAYVLNIHLNDFPFLQSGYNIFLTIMLKNNFHKR